MNAPFIVMCILPSDLSGLTLLSACVYRTFTPYPSKFLLYTIPIFVAVIQYTVHEYPDGLVPVLLASLLQVLGQLAHMQSALQLRHRRRIVECAHQFHVAW